MTVANILCFCLYFPQTLCCDSVLQVLLLPACVLTFRVCLLVISKRKSLKEGLLGENDI